MILDPHWNGVLMHVGKVAEVRKRVDETKAKIEQVASSQPAALSGAPR